MAKKLWSAVDAYLNEKLIPADAVLEAALEANAAEGLPSIDVTATQGAFLQMLARMVRAKRILEIGTLGGYSTIWMGRALPQDGRLITLEFQPHHAAVARANIARAGLSQMVEVRVGPAAESLEEMAGEGEEAFDMIFIDADKPNNPRYLEWAIALSRPGSVIVGDNVVRNGAVVDGGSTDANVIGVRSFLEDMGRHPRLTGTAIQTVGAKGYDGFALAVVLPQ